MPKIGEVTYDVRTIKRLIREGKVKGSVYRKQLESLPDDSQNAIWVDVSGDQPVRSEN